MKSCSIGIGRTWSDGKRSHLFVVAASGGTPRDLTPGADYDVPPFNLGEPESISFSPDSRELCFTANTDKDEAISTNGDLFTVPRTVPSSPSASPPIPATIGAGSIRPTENGSPIARKCSPDMKAIAGG